MSFSRWQECSWFVKCSILALFTWGRSFHRGDMWPWPWIIFPAFISSISCGGSASGHHLCLVVGNFDFIKKKEIKPNKFCLIALESNLVCFLWLDRSGRVPEWYSSFKMLFFFMTGRYALGIANQVHDSHMKTTCIPLLAQSLLATAK